MIKKFNLQIFAEDGAGTDGGSQGAGTQSTGAGTDGGSQGAIDYEKLAQIIAGKQSATEDSVIRGYLKQQGLSKDEMDAAVSAFKEAKAKNDPAKKVEALQAEVSKYKRESVLREKNVRPDDYDYVIFKAQKKVDDNTTFEKAVDNFLKENPRFIKGQGSYKVDTGSKATGKTGEKGNSEINDIIRRRFGR